MSAKPPLTDAERDALRKQAERWSELASLLLDANVAAENAATACRCLADGETPSTRMESAASVAWKAIFDASRNVP